MLAIAAELDYDIFMLDILTAFLNADVEDDVFAKMAPGYEIADKSGVPLVMKLKSLWSPAEPEDLVRHGRPSPRQNRVPLSLKSDPCIYVFIGG